MPRASRPGSPVDWIRQAVERVRGADGVAALEQATRAAEEDLAGSDADEASRLQLTMEILRQEGDLDDSVEQAFSEAIDAVIERS